MVLTILIRFSKLFAVSFLPRVRILALYTKTTSGRNNFHIVAFFVWSPTLSGGLLAEVRDIATGGGL
jgi:hypothetical protein